MQEKLKFNKENKLKILTQQGDGIVNINGG